MPIIPHPSFKEPNADERLWRYMEFAKFVSMLTSGGVWFCNAGILARDDPLDGTLPKPNIRRFTASDLPAPFVDRLNEQLPKNQTLEVAIKNYLDGINRLPQMSREMRDSFLVSCWHAADEESAAMWKSYGKHDGGVAITTNLNRLREAFKIAPQNFYCGRIDYIDFDTAVIPLDNLFNPLLRKRRSFRSENEVRLVYGDTEFYARNKQPLSGMLMQASMHDLVEEIWISPTAPSWFVGVVEEVCRLTSFNGSIRRSSLLDPPHTLDI